jgi:DNA-directed RNA polymerase III subunit RPC1
MHRIAKLSARWIGSYGMTIGIGDVTPSKSLEQINKNVIEESYKEYDKYMLSYKIGTLESKPGMTLK